MSRPGESSDHEGGEQVSSPPINSNSSLEGGADATLTNSNSFLGGGVAAPPSNLNLAGTQSVIFGAEIEGVESALRTGRPAAPHAALANLQGGERVVMNHFTFPSPFLPPARLEKAPDALKEPAQRPNPAMAMSSTLPSSDSPSVQNSGRVSNIPFSQMSAQDLIKIVADKIHGFECKTWISEDVSGAALLGFVAPSALNEFLESLNIHSQFTRTRIRAVLCGLIAKDLEIDAGIREEWEKVSLPGVIPLIGRRNIPPQSSNQNQNTPSSILAPQNLFATPVFGGARRETTDPSPSVLFGGRREIHQQSSNYTLPSFLKECGSPEEFPMEGISPFTDNTRAVIHSGGMNLASQVFGSSGFNITINQPSATPPKYIILECASDSDAFYNWIRKNRKESLLALPVDRRTLSQLVAQDVKDEVVRIIKRLGAADTFYFNQDTCPYPNSWPEVSDLLLLKILFAMNGPRSASEAKLRLKQRQFWFNDSTTSQDKFTSKLRKFCSDFKGILKDFAYTHHLWEKTDVLDHSMIVEAFSECFNNTEQIKGPDGTTLVPKSRNYAKIREMIRERKSLPLEEIIQLIIEAYERVDGHVRSNRFITYDIKPWKVDDKKKKRGFNQIAGQASQPNAKKPPRPPAEHPRCANCGRKSHLCGERSCYLFGHEKGRGVSGKWMEGEPSLALDKEEWKKWKVVRDPIYYGYAENQRPAKATKAGP
jgi:hypothetical protein